MSCGDRPRKERMKLVPVYDEDGQYICSEKVSKLEFLVRNIVDEVLGKDRVEPYGKTFNKLEEFIEQAKTEAKIEVLEEVLGDLDNKFKQLVEMGSKPSKERPRDITRDLFAKFFIAKKLDNLKKKKK